MNGEEGLLKWIAFFIRMNFLFTEWSKIKEVKIHSSGSVVVPRIFIASETCFHEFPSFTAWIPFKGTGVCVFQACNFILHQNKLYHL